MAELYYNSVGLPKRDYAIAYQWYLIASGLGSKEAAAFIPRMEQAVLKDPTSMPSKRPQLKKRRRIGWRLTEEIAFAILIKFIGSPLVLGCEYPVKIEE